MMAFRFTFLSFDRITDEHLDSVDQIFDVVVDHARSHPRLADLSRLEVDLFFAGARTKIEKILHDEFVSLAESVEEDVREELADEEDDAQAGASVPRTAGA